MRQILSALTTLVLWSVSSALYASSCYVGAGLGSAYWSGISTKKEDSLLTGYVKTNTEVNGKSKPHEIFFGCAAPWNTVVEATIMDSFVAATKHTDTAETMYQGYYIPAVGLDQRITVKAYGISILKYIDISGPVVPLIRLGILAAQGSYDADIPFKVDGVNKYSLHYHDEISKTVPYVGVGLEFSDKMRPVLLRIEERVFAKNFQITILSVGYKF
jgi:hypothetical protein